MKQVFLKIRENSPLNSLIMKMTMQGDLQGIKAGQFVNIKIDGLYLRRPISVCEISGDNLTIIYKIVGKGTEIMSKMKSGEVLDVLTCLGNGYDLSLSGNEPLLIGGGVGVPPMYELCKELIAQNKKPTVILGFNTASEIFYEKEFNLLGAKTIVTTVDGSYGIKGFVTDAMKDLTYSYFYTCGPEPMLKAVYKASVTDGEMSFEERMGCGFGACMGCSCKTITGNKRICKEGPVLKKGEVIW
jgi:dihydroorotate dehydrogenase electron transfer subunit